MAMLQAFPLTTDAATGSSFAPELIDSSRFRPPRSLLVDTNASFWQERKHSASAGFWMARRQKEREQDTPLATSVDRLPAHHPGDRTARQRTYRVRHIELTASGRMWPIGDTSIFHKSYRKHGTCVGEAYLAADRDIGISVESQVGYGTIRWCNRDLAVDRPTAGTVQHAIDIT